MMMIALLRLLMLLAIVGTLVLAQVGAVGNACAHDCHGMDQARFANQPQSLFGTATQLNNASWLMARLTFDWSSSACNASVVGHNALTATFVCAVLVDVRFVVHDATSASFGSIACDGEPAAATIAVSADDNTSSTEVAFPFMFDPNDCVQRFLHPFRDAWMGGNSSSMALSWNATAASGADVVWTVAHHVLTVVPEAAAAAPGGGITPKGRRSRVPTGAFCYARTYGNGSASGLVKQFARVDILGPINQALAVSTRCNNSNHTVSSCPMGSPLSSSCRMLPLAWDASLREMYPAPPHDVVHDRTEDRNYVPLSFEPGVVEPWWPLCVSMALQQMCNTSTTMHPRYRWFFPSSNILLLVGYPAAVAAGGYASGSATAATTVRFERCALTTVAPHPLWVLPDIVTGAANTSTVVVFDGASNATARPRYCGSYGGMPSLRIELLNATRHASASDDAVQYTTTEVWATVAVSSNGFDAPPVAVALTIYYAANGDAMGSKPAPVTVQDPVFRRLSGILGTVGRSPWMQLEYLPRDDVFWCALSVGAFSLTPCAA